MPNLKFVADDGYHSTVDSAEEPSPPDPVLICAMRVRAADEAVLLEMGYTQELHRGFSKLMK
jgi:hypothetical protein